MTQDKGNMLLHLQNVNASVNTYGKRPTPRVQQNKLNRLNATSGSVYHRDICDSTLQNPKAMRVNGNLLLVCRTSDRMTSENRLRRYSTVQPTR